MDRLREPLITVVISTRNRGASVVMPLRGVLTNRGTDVELIVVDQSDDERTQTAVAPYLEDPRIRYIRSFTKGAARGRNLGIAAARSELIAITDDDCELPADWLEELVRAFAVDSKVAVVFGSVLAAPFDPGSSFVVSCVRTRPVLTRSFRESYQVEGTSACMGLKQSVWVELGGFDEMLGVGAPFKAAEETDFAIRVLLRGHHIFETPSVAVSHHSTFPLDRMKSVAHGYLYGNGATLAKHLKCAHWPVVKYYIRHGWDRALSTRAGAVAMGSRAHKISKIVAFARGFFAGSICPVDRRRGHFAPAGPPLAGRSVKDVR